MANTWLDDVAVSDDIEIDWGNTIRDRVVHYFPSTTERDAEITGSARKVGMVVMVGTASGTTTAMPRYYMWNGTAWQPIGWWGSTGRIGCTLTDSAQSISNNSTTDITWGTEVHDPDGWTSGASATLTVPSGFDGVYTCTVSTVWATSALGTNPAAAVIVNGGTAYASGGTNPFGVHAVSFTRPLAATDTIKFSVYQNSGGAVNATSRLDIYAKGR